MVLLAEPLLAVARPLLEAALLALALPLLEGARPLLEAVLLPPAQPQRGALAVVRVSNLDRTASR